MCFQHAQLKACAKILKSYMPLLSWGSRVFPTSIRGVVWCNSWKTPGIWYSRTSLVRTGVICIAKDLKETEVVFVIIKGTISKLELSVFSNEILLRLLFNSYFYYISIGFF